MFSSITDIQLFQILKEKLGEEKAEALVSFISLKVIENYKESSLQKLATREDITRFNIKISEAKSDIFKWFFSFFVALMLAIIGLYFKK